MTTAVRLGLMIMTLSAISFSASDISIKVLGGNLSSWQIVAARGLMGMVFAVFLARFNFKALWVSQWTCQLLMGAACGLGFTCFVVSVKLLPLSIAIPVFYIFPAFGALLAPVINKESPDRSDWTAIFLAFTSVVFLSRGVSGQAGNSFTGVVIALIGAFFVGLMSNLARRQSHVPLCANVFFVYLVNFAIGFPLALIYDNPILPAWPDLLKLFGFIIPFSMAGFSFMFLAYRYISAHRGGLVLTLEAVIAAAYGLLFLGEPLTFNVALGGLLMLASAIIIVRR